MASEEEIAIKLVLETDKANLTLGELEDGFAAMSEEIKGVSRGSDRFNELSQAMASTSAELQNVEAGFEGLGSEAIAGQMGGLAGGIGDVTSALVLMGGENETMQQMAASIEIAMAVSMGFKGAIEATAASKKLYNNLVRTGRLTQLKATIQDTIATAKTWLLNAAKKAYAMTTGVLTGKIKLATIAQKIFNTAVKANPVAIIITLILAAGAAYLAFAKDTAEAGKQQEALADSLEAVKGEITKVYEEVNKMETAFALAKDGVITKEEALETYNTTIGETIGQATTLEEAEARFDKNTDAYVQAAIKRAQAQQLIKMAAEEQTAALLASEEDNRAWHEKTAADMRDRLAVVADYSTLGLFEIGKATEKANEVISQAATERMNAAAQENADRFTGLAKSLEAEAGLIEKENGFITDADKKAAADKKADADKKAADADKKAADDKADADKKAAARKAQREKDKAEAEKAAADELAIAEKAAADAIALEIEKNKLLEDLEAKAIEDKTTRSLAELEIAQERERAQLIEKYGLDTELLKALETEQLLQMNTLIADIEKEARENKATLDQEARDKDLEDTQIALDKKNEQREKDFESAKQLVGALSSLNGAALERDLKNAGDNEALKEKLRKASFEREKKLNIAMALINGAQAQMSILAQTPKADFGVATVIAMVAAAATTIGQIAAIKSTSYQGGGSVAPPPESPVLPDGAGGGGGGAQINAVTNTSTILGNQQVYVTETDITSTQNNVSVIEESATF